MRPSHSFKCVSLARLVDDAPDNPEARRPEAQAPSVNAFCGRWSRKRWRRRCGTAWTTTLRPAPSPTSSRQETCLVCLYRDRRGKQDRISSAPLKASNEPDFQQVLLPWASPVSRPLLGSPVKLVDCLRTQPGMRAGSLHRARSLACKSTITYTGWAFKRQTFCTEVGALFGSAKLPEIGCGSQATA